MSSYHALISYTPLYPTRFLTCGTGAGPRPAGSVVGPMVASAEGEAGAGRAPSVGAGVDGSGWGAGCSGCGARRRRAGKARRLRPLPRPLGVAAGPSLAPNIPSVDLHSSTDESALVSI